ncbi:28S ribosomal protein S14, mitochondrial [Venturia canescens]|uniref:28S ribosomal protein S14, mitochondrial n=1 Tax=Venturia canescens TaxID=32260 RepID=UPI001C9D341F|nr:28S ribosomal protein S14, mitochondrial [Venturia canescens]
MAGLGSLLSGVTKLFRRGSGITAVAARNESTTAVTTTKPIRPKLVGMNWEKWPDHKMYRDVRRRRLVKEHAPMRLRLISMKRNDILPPEIRELASKDMDEIPRQAALRQIVFRCKLTSRPRGVVYRWGLSRIVFRDLADFNKLSGVQRAMW